MNESKAREALGSSIQEDNSLSPCGYYLEWPNRLGEITMDGTFTVNDIAAILWWVENKEVIK